MASLTPGTGGTLKSTSIEAAFHEALCLATLAEQDSLKNPQKLRRVGLSLDLRMSQVSGSFSFVFEPTAATDGAATFPITEYLIGINYAKGTGGELKSSALCGAIVELAEKIQAKQRLTSKNPSGMFAITRLAYNSDVKIVSGFFAYNVTGSVVNGIFSTAAKTFLMD